MRVALERLTDYFAQLSGAFAVDNAHERETRNVSSIQVALERLAASSARWPRKSISIPGEAGREFQPG